MYREVIAGYGLAARMAAFKAIDLPPDAFLTPSDAAEPILAAICELAEAGADTVIIGGAPLAGLGRQPQDPAPLPILHGGSSPVRLAPTPAALAVPRPRPRRHPR